MPPKQRNRNRKNHTEVALQKAKRFEELKDNTAYMPTAPMHVQMAIEEFLRENVNDEFSVEIEALKFDSLRMMRVLLFQLYKKAGFDGEENFDFCMSVPRESLAHYMGKIFMNLGPERYRNAMSAELTRVVSNWNAGNFSVSMDRTTSMSPAPRSGNGAQVQIPTQQTREQSIQNPDYEATSESTISKLQESIRVLGRKVLIAMNDGAKKDDVAMVKTLLSISGSSEMIKKDFSRDVQVFTSNESWFIQSLGECGTVATKIPVYRFDRDYTTFFTAFVRDLCLEVQHREKLGPIEWRNDLMKELGYKMKNQKCYLPSPSEFSVFQLAFADPAVENFITAVEIALLIRGKLTNTQQLAMVQISRMSAVLIRDDFKRAHEGILVMDGWPVRVSEAFDPKQFRTFGLN